MNIKTRLKKWRGCSGKNPRGLISQTAAAAQIGVNVRTLQDWELGRATPRGIALNAVLWHLDNFKPQKPDERPTKKSASKRQRR